MPPLPHILPLLTGLFLLATPAHAQQDAWWLFGLPPDNSYAFDFRQEEMVFQSMEHGGVMRNGPTISSPDGRLLFYSNGHGVLNRNHEFMHNAQGDSLLAPAWANESAQLFILPEHTLILPMPGRDSMFYVIYYDGPTLAGPNIYPPYHASTVKYSVVNLKLNNGLGGIEAMNIKLLEDSLAPVVLEAVRHANGRDWWVLVYRPSVKQGFYRFLVKKDTITGPYFQEIKSIYDAEVPFFFGNIYYPLCASPDGSMLGIGFPSNRVVILDFDRCTGAMSIRHTAQPLPVPDWEAAKKGEATMPANQVRGCSFSPNNRYFYLSRHNERYLKTTADDTMPKGILTQYDLHLAGDSLDTAETIIYVSDSLDSIPNNFPRWIFFSNHQLGPDGKIYIGSGGSGRFVHVIESPDSAGEKCDLAFAKYFMPGIMKKAAYIPVNFPNFQLGTVPVYTADAGQDATVQPGDTVVLGSGPGAAGLAYQWAPEAGLSDPYHPQPVAIPDSTVTYYLTITDTTVTSAPHCTTRTDAATITVEHPPEEPEPEEPPPQPEPPPEPIIIPTLLLPEQHSPVFRIHGLPEQSRLRVYNALGQEVYAAEHYQNDWNVSRLAAAMYFYVLEMPPDKVPAGEAHLRRGKIVVVR